MKLKWIIITTLFICITNNISAQPVIEFSRQVWDFGTITEGAIVSHVFLVKNVGKEILKIDDVSTTCGCTAALLDKEVIKPGEKTELKVIFDSQRRKGRVEKYVEIESNDPNNHIINLIVTGYIEKGVESVSDVVPEAKLEVEESIELETQTTRKSRYLESEIQSPKSEIGYIKPINRLVIFYLSGQIDNLDEVAKVIKNAGERGEGKAILKIAIGSLSKEKTDLMVDRLNIIKCDALLVKENECELAEKLANRVDFSIICPIHDQPYIIKDFKGLKVGIIGVSNTTYDLIEKYLVELKQKSDLIIFLTDMSLEKAKELAREVEGIDIIIPTQGDKHPVKVGKTIIATGGNFGNLKIFLDITREIIGYHGKSIIP